MNASPADDAFIHEVDRRLRIYGSSRHFNRSDPLDELIFIILSAQTESYSYLETYKDLKRKFNTREALFRTHEASIAAAIKRGGLAKKKAAQIKGALKKIHADRGQLSLAFLSKWDDAKVEAYLTSLPGIGLKSAHCIMMYSLGRKVFPVDTHVWKICRRLGMAPQIPKPTPAMERELELKVPEDIRFTLHVNMISHGRAICTTYWPQCSQCVLADICPSKDKPDQVWGEWRKPRGIWKNYADQGR